MKKLLLFLMLLSATNAFAQDVIVKKDGSTIVSRVLKITSTEVEYKKFSNLNGPTYTILKSEVQSINYENGEKETFGSASTASQTQLPYTISNPQNLNSQPLSDKQLLNIAEESFKYDKKIKRLKIAGWTAGAALTAGGIVIMCCNIGRDRDPALIIPGTILMASGITTTTLCLVRANKLKQQSLYSIHTTPIFQYEMALHNGSKLLTGINLINDSRLQTQALGLGINYNF